MTRTRLLPRTHLCWFESMVALNAAKRQVVLKAFDQTNYDHEAASRLLGLHPNYSAPADSRARPQKCAKTGRAGKGSPVWVRQAFHATSATGGQSLRCPVRLLLRLLFCGGP